MERQFKRLWTVEEARAILPQVAAVLHQIQQDIQKMEICQREIDSANATAKGNGHSQKAEQAIDALEAVQIHLSDLLDQLDAWGIELKDPSRGLIDFPHLREGRVVYLCWELSEDTIRYWHELDGGFGGRQPL